MIDDLNRRAEAAGRQLGRAIVGDRAGLVVFLGALVWAGALWRVGFFLQDSVTVANTLANVGAGRLELVELPYSLTLGEQPGIVRVDGEVYGRNYGHALAALPVLWLLEGLSLVADLRLVIAAGWSLLVVALGWHLAQLTGRDGIVTVGSLFALVTFLANVALVASLPADRLELMALQLTTMLAAAVLATLLYRLLARFHGRPVGLAAGAAVVVASPVGFWSSVPKRHVLTATVVVAVLYCFAVSRTDTGRRGQLARAGAYVAVGLLTTVHAFEAFFLFFVLVPLDLLTASRNDVRTLGVVVVLFALSLVPFFVLNLLITGHPLRPPRLLSNAVIDLGPASGGGEASETPTSTPVDTGSTNVTSETNATTEAGSTTTDVPAGDDSGGSDGILPVPLSRVVGFAITFLSFTLDQLAAGFDAVRETERLYHVFIRGGEIPSIPHHVNDYEMVELTLLESFPLAAALVWLPVAAANYLRRGLGSVVPRTPRRQTDLLAVCLAVVFTLIYLPRLPLHSQITVRYLLPIVPILIYGIARLVPVRAAVTDAPRYLAGGYVATVGIGGAVLTGVLVALDPAIGEAMQFHALVGLATAFLALLSVQLWPTYRNPRAVAAGLAIPAGITTVFLLLAGIEYFHYRLPGLPPGHEPFALDVIRVLAELLPILHP